MTSTVSGGTLNPTRSLTLATQENANRAVSVRRDAFRQ